MFNIGDLIEPTEEETPLPPGLYRVVHSEPGSARLMLVHASEADATAPNMTRTFFVPATVLERCCLVQIDED